MIAGTTAAAVLKVGPGEKCGTPSAAILAADVGDTIQIGSTGDYSNNVSLINKSNLSIDPGVKSLLPTEEYVEALAQKARPIDRKIDPARLHLMPSSIGVPPMV